MSVYAMLSIKQQKHSLGGKFFSDFLKFTILWFMLMFGGLDIFRL